ncbi:hypothetical protein EVAR_37874_1 [Eumeta japonica]|uniref:Uncharacterized protein n=1 Tax=Eumeta variegata TaxID=151549 RepID=A0A4C1Y9B8_EUMVA|nr:hypothetical protein EVAR_37874_1 [Eumeta japonica]
MMNRNENSAGNVYEYYVIRRHCVSKSFRLSGVITYYLSRRFDDFQPPEQAGFLKGFSIVGHIHTLRQIIQNSEQYVIVCYAYRKNSVGSSLERVRSPSSLPSSPALFE